MGQESLAPRPLGTNHPRYTLVKDLNKGAQGFVQLCKDELTGELVAIKFIERGDKVTQYVEREIINHRSLCHPHVIQFKEVFLTPRHLGIAMEYAAGGDLFEYIMSRDKRLLEAHSRWFFQQLIVALDYCHKMGVANRDIKLENTLLDSNSPPLLKLCDFGYSKNSKIQSAPRSLVGTPAYLAPEVICAVRGKEYDGQAADVWSSGVMLYVMLVGGYPFERPEDKKDAYAMRAMYVRIQAADYRVPAVLKLSQNCQDLLARMLVADPAQRITIPEIQRHPWYTQGLPVGVLDMNDHFEPVPEGVQSEEAIRAILDEARRPVGGPGIPMAIPVGNGAHPMTRDTLDELVDDALLNPHDDSDPEMLCDNPHRMRYKS